MRLPDGPRQIIAALMAATVFLGLYFAVSLVWWAAFALAVLTYLAFLLIIRRRTPADEIMLTARVSAADIRQAAANMEAAAKRLDYAAEQAPQADRGEITHLATTVRAIREQVIADPDDYRQVRRFVTSYLPHLVETVEGYTTVARRAGGNHDDRLAPLAQRIRGFGPVLDRINAACLENDFDALEVQIDALATQMKRG